MAEDFEVWRALAGGLPDRAGVWRFLSGFAAAWVRPLTGRDGYGQAELDAAEARLGLRLPAALREAYALFGRRDDLTRNQDVLLAPAELYLHPAGEALVFREENQAVVSWGVLLADLGDSGDPDPPVVIRSSLADESAESWQPWLPSFSAACLDLVLSETLFLEEGFADNRALTAGEADLLERRYERLPLPTFPLYQADMPGIRWFTGPDVVLRDDGEQWVWVRARTQQALDAVRATLPGDWPMVPYAEL